MHAVEHPLYAYLRKFYAVDAVLPVARASLGLLASLRAWRALGHEPIVCLCANVCHDVVAAVLGAGFHPVFLDMDPATGLVPDSEWCRARAAGASVALVVHLYGNPADVMVVREQFPVGDALLIDDAAQALGASNKFGFAGAQGDVGLLSFGATKHISASGAALLFRSNEFAECVKLHLDTIPLISSEHAERIRSSFRQGLEVARQQLRETEGSDIRGFNGLLNGYASVLSESMREDSANMVWHNMLNYEHIRDERNDKAAAWGCALQGSGLIPVGMGEGAVPWRYVCRLPGLNWMDQHQLAETMRGRGVNVSHWYLPAHWMFGAPAGSLLGVEQLASEIFQFWVDAITPMERIQKDAVIVKSVLESFLDGPQFDACRE